MGTEPHQPACSSDLYGTYEAMYDSLRDEVNRSELLEAARRSRRCPRVRPDCALVQALFDANRRIPKRSRVNFFATMELVAESYHADAADTKPRPR